MNYTLFTDDSCLYSHKRLLGVQLVMQRKWYFLPKIKENNRLRGPFPEVFWSRDRMSSPVCSWMIFLPLIAILKNWSSPRMRLFGDTVSTSKYTFILKMIKLYHIGLLLLRTYKNKGSTKWNYHYGILTIIP